MQTELQGEACTDLPTCTMFPPREPVFINKVPALYFNQSDRDFPHPVGAMQLYLHWHLHQPIRAALL